MTSGPTIHHLFDPLAADHERGALHHSDALAIARLARESVAPQCRHREVTLPGRTLGAAALALRRVNRPGSGSERRSDDGRSLLHCYSWRAARAARLSFGRAHPIILSVGEESEEPRSMLGVARPDRVLHHGVAASRDTLALAPARGEVSQEDRAVLREALGIHSREFVVGALAEPGAATNARWLVFFAGILVAGGLDLTILVPRSLGHTAAQVDRMRRFHATTRLNLRVVIVEKGCDVGPDEPASAWHACDVAVLRPDPWSGEFGEEPALRSIRRSHACGVPVITPRSLSTPSLFPPSIADTLVVSAGTTKQVARALTALIERPELASSLRARVRETARSRDASELCDALREAYKPATRGLLTGAARPEAVA